VTLRRVLPDMVGFEVVPAADVCPGTPAKQFIQIAPVVGKGVGRETALCLQVVQKVIQPLLLVMCHVSKRRAAQVPDGLPGSR